MTMTRARHIFTPPHAAPRQTALRALTLLTLRLLP